MSGGSAHVLDALREQPGIPCSGEALSTQLSVSRAQIWKHVESLRKRGYEIEGEPGGGYRLVGVPDRLYPEEIQAGLGTRWLGHDIHYFDETDSTNRVAMDLARAGADHGTAVVAEAQSAGRGRLGRSFYSPSALNLYTSLVLRPTGSIAEAPGLILASASAVADAVAASLGADRDGDVTIKWPNDVQIGGLKTCGILVELNAEANRIDFAVLGIGVNLNVERESFPDEFRHLATSLRSALGHAVDRAEFTRRLYRRLESVLDLHAGGGFQAVRRRFEARFQMPGQRVRVLQTAGAEIAGVVKGIAGDGSLVLESDDGHTHSIIAGDVTLSKEDPAS